MTSAHLLTQKQALRDILVCPDCGGALAWTETLSACRECGRTHPIFDGIPILTAACSLDPHKLQQAEAHDVADDSEFEIERPHGAPRFHEWLLRFKFTCGTNEIATVVRDGRALVVCAGSGMDAEFLAERGAAVLACDISHGAAIRARERGERRGLPILSFVADAERLPLPSASVDVVYVHDGLHHLQNPSIAIHEMTRVARSAVSINEPARATATAIAVFLRISEQREVSGNEVIRFRLQQLRRELERNGFVIIRSRRFAMFYRHVPGPPSRLLSTPFTFRVATTGLRAANRVAGRFGNKLSVQAVRR
jgi:SAM-dependent methyltransferase